MKKTKTTKHRKKMIKDYDTADTSAMIESSHPIRFSDLGLKAPKERKRKAEVPPLKL